MSTGHLRTLAIILLVLVLGIFALTYSKRLGDGSGGEYLLPDLKSGINEITRVRITKAGETTTLTNDSGKWVLTERQDYAIDSGKLRQLLLALSDAKKLEEKTSKSELYEKLGVADVGPDSQGTGIRIVGPDSEISLILGNLAQRSYRYARISGEEESWLIDQNPTIPSGASGWLVQELLDIDASRVKSVEIVHADGETVRVAKEDSEAATFDVLDIPEGRELSYATVANGITGVLSGLNLQDVAAAADIAEGDGRATAVFTTFDGLTVTVDSFLREENTWIAIKAEGIDDAAGEATEMNGRLDGWMFQLQNYKSDQLRRRWNDILKTEE